MPNGPAPRTPRLRYVAASFRPRTYIPSASAAPRDLRRFSSRFFSVFLLLLRHPRRSPCGLPVRRSRLASCPYHIDVMVETGEHQIRFLTCLLLLSVSDPLPPTYSPPCIAIVVSPFHGQLNRGDLRSARVRRLIARPLQLSGPHHSRRGHPLPSFYIGQGTRVLPLRLIPQELLDRRSPGYLPVVVQLDAVLDPGVSASHSSLTRSPHGLRPIGEDRHVPKINGSRGYVSDSGLHPSPRHTCLSTVSLARHVLTLPGS